MTQLTLNQEVSALRSTLQSLISKAEDKLGYEHDFCSALRSADDNLAEAEDDPAIPLDEQEEDPEE